MTKISFITPTARLDYPYANRPDLHLFEPTLECFKKQTMTDFEWVISDALYEQRKDYFADMKLPFKVKHIPAMPNMWLENGLTGIAAQWNKGIIYADGELLFFCGDSYMVQPNFMERLWKRYTEGYFPFAWYFYDNTYATARENSELHGSNMCKDAKAEFDISYQPNEAPVQYDILGFSGKKAEIEHRYVYAFKGSKQEIYYPNWGWWFGCSSVSLEAMLKINGFDQNFDPDRMLMDCDVGSRLELAGYGNRFALFRDTYLIKIPSAGIWNPSFKNVTIKCNYGLIWLSRFLKRYRANAVPLTDEDIRWIEEEYCPKLPPKGCTNMENCVKNHPWQYPFEHKDGYEGHNCSKEWFNFWREHQTIIDLAQERGLRLRGEKYQEGTFTCQPTEGK